MSNVTVDISVVILSFNSGKHIGKCLSSLFEATEKAKIQAEVFVVENGSVDNSMGCIKGFQSQYGDSLHVIDLKKNTGTTVSYTHLTLPTICSV